MLIRTEVVQWELTQKVEHKNSDGFLKPYGNSKRDWEIIILSNEGWGEESLGPWGGRHCKADPTALRRKDLTSSLAQKWNKWLPKAVSVPSQSSQAGLERWFLRLETVILHHYSSTALGRWYFSRYLLKDWMNKMQQKWFQGFIQVTSKNIPNSRIL